MSDSIGIIKGIAWRHTDSEPMQEVSECRILLHRGLSSENRKPGNREVTLLSAGAWSDVCRELGADIPWHTRRANLLIEGMDLPATIGNKLRIGEVTLIIHGETKPCALMDQQHTGLRDALKPNARGGVYGQVLSAGTIRLGDKVTV